MLNNHHRVPLVHQPSQHAHQHPYILKVQPCRRLVKDIQRLPRRRPRQLRRQFDTLALPARQRGGRLPQLDIPEPHVLYRLYLPQDIRLTLKELHRLIHRHIQHIGYRLPLKPHLQRLAVVALPAACLARHIHIGHEMHLNGLVPVPRTFLAPTAFRIKTEPTGFPSAYLRLGQLGEQVAYAVEYPRVGRRVRPWCPPDRRLVYVYHLVYQLNTLYTIIGKRLLQRAVELLRKDRVERLIDKRRFPAPAHSRNANHLSYRKRHRYILQVIPPTPPQDDGGGPTLPLPTKGGGKISIYRRR